MNDHSDIKQANPNEVEFTRERTKQATIAGWTAGLVGVVAIWHLSGSDSWSAATGTTAIAAMVAYVCHRILPR